MSLLIVCASQEHGNTRKLADAMAKEVGGVVVAPAEATGERIAKHEAVAFGTGVRFGSPYPDLMAAVARLPRQDAKPAVVFSTSGFGWRGGHAALTRALRAKGFVVRDELACKGLDTVGPLKLFGGVNKGRPDAGELRAAAALARRLAPAVPATTVAAPSAGASAQPHA